MESRYARVGFVLFTIYAIIYAGFVLLNAFAANVMEWTPIEGLNLAILYGFGLILIAFLLAGIYGWLCRREDS